MEKAAFWFAVLVFLYVCIVNAWIVDDAYITFRTVDNFVNGFGLTWNTDERVQVYTHPFWMFLISFFRFFSGEVFYTAIAVSLALSLGTIFIIYIYYKRSSNHVLSKTSLLLLLLIASKSFIDYCSSGLENPLSYFLAALFLSKYLLNRKKVSEYSQTDVFTLFFIASLAFFNRQDTILIYLPSLIHVLLYTVKKLRYRLVWLVFIATLPASLWLLFSLFYYGSPVPNTAYAKYLNDLTVDQKVQIGVSYYINSIKWDTASYGFAVGAFVLASIKRAFKHGLVLAGMGSYLLYILIGAAAATHMSGRFFAVPFFVAIVLFVDLLESRTGARIVAVAAVCFVIIHPLSSIKFGTDFYDYKPEKNAYNHIDTKWHVYQQGAALLSLRNHDKLPDHVWYKEGEEFKTRPEKINVGGARSCADAIGYFAYAAGPHKYIIDIMTLSDPLRARLPVVYPNNDHVRSGHFYRLLPERYIESLKQSKNLIRNKDLQEFYDKLLIVIRGPLFAKGRIQTIIKLNMGKYDYLLARYVKEEYNKNINQNSISKLYAQVGPVKD